MMDRLNVGVCALLRTLRSHGPRIATLLIVLCALLTGCGRSGGDVHVLVDGEVWQGDSVALENGEDLRVYITLDGKPLIDLPFSEAHSVKLIQPGVGENTVEITGDSVYMGSADCENQDCVNMGRVTRDNLELRVMGGFIICLPHKISVEVRGD